MFRTPYGFDLQSFETSLACNLASVPWLLWTFASKPWVRPGDISRYALVAYRVRCPEGLLQGSTWFRPARWSVYEWIPTVCAVSTAVKLRRRPLFFDHHRRGTRCRIFRDCRWIATRCREPQLVEHVRLLRQSHLREATVVVRGASTRAARATAAPGSNGRSRLRHHRPRGGGGGKLRQR